ncbi:protein FosB-like isoform X1 [Clytia hemisphaerica]|uniref:BZIP domain-containing protein n=1 Tax=Clytia hemisphaerica TaxID=252671 RepID=A0A7M5V3F6_9CNID
MPDKLLCSGENAILLLESPVMENKPFLIRDPMLMEDAIFMKEQDDDDFSTDSWERISNEELDDFVQISNTISSPPTSPATSTESIGNGFNGGLLGGSTDSEDTFKALSQLDDDPPILIKMESEQSPLSMSTFSMSSSPPSFLDTAPSPLMNSTKQQQQQQQNPLNDTPETRAMKRERNRLAARRCRQKQKDRIDYLEKDVKQIETDNFKVENEIKLLRQQLNELQSALINHDCMLKHGLTPRQHYYSVKF